MEKKNVKCEECENLNSMLFCKECDQTLCLLCDKKIHNKGKRINHQKLSILNENSPFLELYKKLINKEKNTNFYHENEIKIKYHFRFNISLLSIINLIGINYLIKKAEKGKLLIKIENFVKCINKYLIKEGFDLPKKNLKGYFIRDKLNLFKITKRNYNNIFNQIYISMKLKYLSLDSIVWILRSLKNDKMQPNDKLVIYRIREYFSIELENKKWIHFCNFLYDKLNIIRNYGYDFSKINLIKIDLDMNKNKFIPKLKFNFLFNILNEDYKYEDLEKINNDNENWKIFIKFLDDFFNMQEESKKNLKKWWSLIKILNNNNYKNKNYIILQNKLLSKKIYKIIPGGRYIGALIIKNCGSQKLKNLSLGYIISLIQYAIDINYLIYYKSILFKNNNHFKNFEIDIKKEIKNKKNDLKEKIVQLLTDKNEVNLAQLMELVRKTFKINYRIQDLNIGLKSLLLEIDNLVIDEKNIARLKINKNNKNSDLKNKLRNKLKNNSNYTNIISKFVNKNSINIEDLEIIKIIILNILLKNPTGIEINQLKIDLSKEINKEFNFKIFKFNSFKLFFMYNFNNLIEINSNKIINNHEFKSNLEDIIYPNITLVKIFYDNLLKIILQKKENDDFDKKTEDIKNTSNDISLFNYNNKLNNNETNFFPNFQKENNLPFFTKYSDIKEENLKDYKNCNSFNINNFYCNNNSENQCDINSNQNLCTDENSKLLLESDENNTWNNNNYEELTSIQFVNNLLNE